MQSGPCLSLTFIATAILSVSLLSSCEGWTYYELGRLVKKWKNSIQTDVYLALSLFIISPGCNFTSGFHWVLNSSRWTVFWQCCILNESRRGLILEVLPNHRFGGRMPTLKTHLSPPKGSNQKTLGCYSQMNVAVFGGTCYIRLCIDGEKKQKHHATVLKQKK